MTGKLRVKGWWEVCLAGVGWEDAELVSELNILENVFSSLALSKIPSI